MATWRSGSARPPLRGPWLSLWLIHSRPGPFTDGRGPPVRAGHERWRTVVNAGAQHSKACEGASLPWVQIPPPPPLIRSVGTDAVSLLISMRVGGGWAAGVLTLAWLTKAGMHA